METLLCSITKESPWYFQFHTIKFIILADLSRTQNKYGSQGLLSQVPAWIIYYNDLIWKSAGTSKSLHKRKSEWGPFSLVSAGYDYYVYYIFLKGLHIFSNMQENYISPLSPTLALCAWVLNTGEWWIFSICFINVYSLDSTGLKSIYNSLTYTMY